MPESIEFDVVYKYNLHSVGITVPAMLSFGDKTAEIDAKIDTGSTYCVFQRLHGELLDIEIESGLRIEIGTPVGSFSAFGHELTLTVLDIQTFSTVYFAKSEFFDRNVLGRTGWLDRLKLGLIDSEGIVLLTR